MKREEYHRGKPGRQYGIWNDVKKEFQFGICEDTPMLAEARLFQKLGDDARKYRFHARALPQRRKAASGEVSDRTMQALAQMGRNAHGGKSYG